MASWDRDTGERDPVPPGHGEPAPEINVGEVRCRCGMRLNRDGTCPLHGTDTTTTKEEDD